MLQQMDLGIWLFTFEDSMLHCWAKRISYLVVVGTTVVFLQ